MLSRVRVLVEHSRGPWGPGHMCVWGVGGVGGTDSSDQWQLCPSYIFRKDSVWSSPWAAQDEIALGEIPSNPPPCTSWSADNFASYFPEKTEAIESELHKLPSPLLQSSLRPCGLSSFLRLWRKHRAPVQSQALHLSTGLYPFELTHGHGPALGPSLPFPIATGSFTS